MKLLHLKGQDFRSFSEFELDFNAPGLYSVTGPNGAGKSSIFGAVEWALFGGKRGPGTPVRREDADGECRVELEFEVNDRVFKVVRIDGSDAWLTDVASATELARGLTDTSHEVAVQLGLTQNMFSGTFYARQKEVQALSSSRSLHERRDQLERLLGIEHLRVAADLAARDAREQKAVAEGLSDEAPDIQELRAEVERCEREARATPAVSELETRVAELRAREQQAVGHIEDLAKQVSEHGSRRLAAEQTAGELTHAQTILDSLRERLATGKAAQIELAELAPVAGRVDEVVALEREMDQRRRNHELFESLRGKERDALQELAEATDALAELGDPPADDSDPASTLSAAQQELNDIGKQLRDAAETRQRAEEAARITREKLGQAKARAETQRELTSLIESEAQVDASRERSLKLRGERADLLAQLNHDLKHRDALDGVGDSGAAVCPTCQRPLEGTLGDLLAEFETAINARQVELAGITRAMEQSVALGKQHEAAAGRAQQLRAQLSSLVDAGDGHELKAADGRATAEAVRATDSERKLDANYGRLADRIPDLTEAAEQAAEASRRRRAVLERKQRAEHAAASYAEQRRDVGSNGYDPGAHAKLRTQLEATQKAVGRSAAVRENADAVQLLDGRVTQQQRIVDELLRKVGQLRERAADVQPTPDAHQNAVKAHRKVADDLEEARRALSAAKQQASVESQAVTAAQTRLEDGSKTLRRVERERQEYVVQGAIANALADYREHASQRARPALESQASNLFKQVTGGSYPLIRLTDRYLLEVADDGRFHPVKRFSGGEQDLAALCLRLALSRTLAGQRGAEHGFVILDEVFGSQDSDRRRLLLQQLGELAEAEFHQIFVISHTEDVSEHCQLHVRVRREDGISVATGPSS